jgi:hypothetical protein
MGRLVIDGRTWLNRVLHTGIKAPNEQHRERILFDIEHLAQMPGVPGPKFVFVHIMSPHPPYVFTADGGVIGDQTVFTLAGDGTPPGLNSTWGYVNQVGFLNPRILEALKAVIENSPVKPIIIVQGDHGAPEISKEDRMKILNAYYFPDGGDKAIYESISPINSFRVMFDQYFGAHLPLLEDRSYFSPVKDPFRLSPVP